MTGGLARLWRDQWRPAIEKALGPGVLAPSPRERGLAALLGATMAGYLCLLAYDYSLGARDRAETAIVAFEAQRRDNEISHQDYSYLVDRELSRARAHSFEGQTFAIARITAQADVETMLREAGVEAGRVATDEAVEGEGRLRTAVLTIDAPFAWPSFVSFVEALSQSPRSFGVVSVSVDMRSARPTFRMRLRASLMTGSEA